MLLNLLLFVQSHVGIIQSNLSPWEGCDEVIDIPEDDDQDDANDPDCIVRNVAVTGRQSLDGDMDWTMERFLQGSDRCHISGASS